MKCFFSAEISISFFFLFSLENDDNKETLNREQHIEQEASISLWV